MMTNIRPTIAACVAVATFAGTGSAHALLIDNTAATTNFVCCIGVPDTATFGELFTTNGSDTFLDSFSLFLLRVPGQQDRLDLRGYIGTWTGTQVGSVLFSGATQTITGNALPVFVLETFSYTPGLQLAANTQYVAFLSASEIDGQAGSQFAAPASTGPDNDASTNGLVFLNNGANESAWTTSAWSRMGGNIRMVANLSPSVQVPAPGTVALLGLGLLTLGGLRRRVA